jgi:hypothetical protein
MTPRHIALASVVLAAGASAVSAPAASAASSPLCRAEGILSAVAGQVCAHAGGATAGHQLLKAGKQLATGNVGGAIQTTAGGAAQAVVSTASTAIALAAIGAGVVGAAQGILNETAAAVSTTTSPQLRASWFSSTYWRMAAIAAMLTLPFLFAAAVQALIRSDIGLLARAAFGYLPLAMLAIAIATPLTMLVLAATDQLCALISAAAGKESAHFLARAGLAIAGLTAAGQSPFLVLLVGLFVIGATFALWIELLMREAAVYVIVLMLPLVFAAMVWPARRIWAVRAVELLVALVLSKFAIVAVLALGGSAISVSSADQSVTGIMAGAVLITLAAFSPWAMLRLLPLAELASGAAGSLRGELRSTGSVAAKARAAGADAWVASATAGMRRDAGDIAPDLAPPSRNGSDASGGPEPPPMGPPDDPGPPDDRDPPRDGDPGPPDDPDPPRDGDLGPPVTPAAPEPDFATMPVLELGAENLFATPVYPHEDAS